MRYRASLVIVVLMSMMIFRAEARITETQEPQVSPIRFEVAAIHRSDCNVFSQIVDKPASGRIQMVCMPMADMLFYAFDLHDEAMLTGLPKWARSDKFSVNAKVSSEDYAAYSHTTEEQRRFIFRQLLIEKFGIQFRESTKSLPSYSLVVSRQGPKMEVSSPTDDAAAKYPGGRVFSVGPNSMKFDHVSMTRFLISLSALMKRPVIDQTGLTGLYTFSLVWRSPENAGLNDQPPSEPEIDEVPLIMALRQQLGLDLKSERRKLPIIEIERIQHSGFDQ